MQFIPRKVYHPKEKRHYFLLTIMISAQAVTLISTILRFFVRKTYAELTVERDFFLEKDTFADVAEKTAVKEVKEDITTSFYESEDSSISKDY